MRGLIAVVPLVATANAFVFPDAHVFAQLPIQPEDHINSKPPAHHNSWTDRPRSRWGRLWKSTWKSAHDKIPHTLDEILDLASDEPRHPPGPPHHRPGPPPPPDHGHPPGPPQRRPGPPPPPDHGHPPGPPHRHPGPPPPPDHGHPPPPPGKRPGRPGWWRPGGRPRKGGRRGHHHHAKPNQTIYELISGSKYTTNFTQWINKFDDVVQLLNSTEANYTIFAPINSAFDKLPKHLPHVPDEVVKRVLLYHVLPETHSKWKLVFEHTSPTLFKADSLNGNPQRVRSSWSLLHGVTVNFFSKVVAADIPATNGLIHGVSSILLPPPPGLAILSHLPGTFSTLELGLRRTGLWDKIAAAPNNTIGGTLFAPSNTAFKKLGPRANAFLFSRFGEKYLKALLKYHIVRNKVLYSTAFYDGDKKDDGQSLFHPFQHHQCHDASTKTRGYPHVHVDLPTLLEGKNLSIDIFRRGPILSFLINSSVAVSFQDALAREGVIQVVNNVIIPPKAPGAAGGKPLPDGEISVEELVNRLKPFVNENEDADFEALPDSVQEALVEQNLEL